MKATARGEHRQQQPAGELGSEQQYRGLAETLALCAQWAGAGLGHPGQDKVRALAAALVEAVAAAGRPPAPRLGPPGFACPECEGVLVSPVTLACGHTCCRRCVEAACGVCGLRSAGHHPDTNILVRGLVEKWWPAEGEAAALRDQGNELFQRGDLEGALATYDRALSISPENHLVLSNRSHALLRLFRPQRALADADTVVRLRPTWGKGHYRRGCALLALGRPAEALAALCVCASLDARHPGVRQEMGLALQRLVAAPWHYRPQPGPPPPAHHLTSDCEENPSDSDEDAPTECHNGNILNPIHEAWGSISISDSCDCSFSRFSPAIKVSNQLVVSQDNGKLSNVLDCVIREVERIKHMESDTKSSLALSVDLDRVDCTDFDCILCCRTLWRPVTTPCGHTYCWSCLDRCLDYSCACPLCMTSLVQYVASSPRNVTEFIDLCVRVLLPNEWETRRATQSQDLALAGPHIPMFVCTVAFPGVPCPLFVYEPRYRNMVRRCMQAGSRQFGMAACLSKEPGTKRYAEFGTLQEIRDCVLLADGCSIVTTVGARRFRVVARSEHDGYDTAMVEFVKDQPIEDHQLPAMYDLHERVRLKGWRWFHSTTTSIQSEIIRTFGTMPPVEPDWAKVPDGPAWTWWLLAILPLGPRLQVGVLATTSLEKRLRAIDKTLDHIQHCCPPPAIQHSGQAQPSSTMVLPQPS